MRISPTSLALWRIIGALGMGLVVLSALLLTSPSPWLPQTPAANAVQVEAARNAFRQVLLSRETGRPTDLYLSGSDLESIGALLNQGLPPHRLALTLDNGTLLATVSRPLWFRWLNVRASARGVSKGFPQVQLTVGSVHLSTWLSKLVIKVSRGVLAARGVSVPPLDSVVQSSEIGAVGLKASILLPRAGLIDQLPGGDAVRVSPATVASIYCRLVAQQRATPNAKFVDQLTRAFAASKPTAEGHSAALVAVAMIVVDPRVGELIGDARERVDNCLAPPLETTLWGRTDWPKHWALSAALTVTAGRPLAVALGEWKELSDSLSPQQYLGAGDRSGFSVADLAADRSGILTARALLDPATLRSARARLLGGTEESVMPMALTRLGDGMSNAEFVRRFGATDDPRFDNLVRQIDSDLARAQKP